MFQIFFFSYLLAFIWPLYRKLLVSKVLIFIPAHVQFYFQSIPFLPFVTQKHKYRVRFIELDAEKFDKIIIFSFCFQNLVVFSKGRFCNNRIFGLFSFS